MLNDDKVKTEVVDFNLGEYKSVYTLEYNIFDVINKKSIKNNNIEKLITNYQV